MKGTRIVSSDKSAAKGRIDTGLEMTNFDHTIDDGLEEALRAGNTFGCHPGLEHWGIVWFADGQFHEEVWTYGAIRGILTADSLQALMELVNETYGID